MSGDALRHVVEGPFGRMTLVEVAGVLAALHWGADPGADPAAEMGPDTGAASPLLAEAAAQLRAYFAGRLTVFDLPLAPGEGLQAGVRRAMAAIPYGQTRSYGDLARLLGVPAQAVGQACGANPLPILIPCHRVTGQGWFGGFSAPGGVETKAALLRLEGALLL